VKRIERKELNDVYVYHPLTLSLSQFILHALGSEQRYATFSFLDEFQGKKKIREIFVLATSTFRRH
jgi:hypothetical protein